MTGWKEIKLIAGEPLSVRLYYGQCDVDAMKKFEYWKTLMNDHLSIEIPNSDGVHMRVDKVELLIKERDLEYNLEFCDIFVTGTIL